MSRAQALGVLGAGWLLPLLALATEPAWEHDAGSAIFGSPAAAVDTVFVGTHDGTLLALRIADGTPAWTLDTDGAFDASPTVHAGSVYIQNRNGYLYAVAAADGTVRWRAPTGEPGQVDFWDFTLSGAAVHDDLVIVGSGDGALRAHRVADGSVAWTHPTGGPVRATPLVVDGIVYFGSFDGRFRAVDARDGSLRWSFKTVGSTYFPEGAIQGGAMHHEGVVYFGSRDYNLYALDAARGTGRWNFRTPSWVIGPPVAVDGRVFIGTSDSRALYALDQRSGEVQWTQSTRARVFASPVVFDGALHFGGFDGRLYAIDPADGAPMGAFRTRGGVANDHKVYDENGDFSEAFRALYSSGQGLLAEQTILELGSIASAPLAAGDTLVFGSTDGRVYTLAAGSSVVPAAAVDPNADVLAWARDQYGARLLEPIDVFHGDFTGDGVADALAWVLYASGGNSHFLDVALFRSEAGRLVYYRSADGVFGGEPRNVVFAPGRITLTSTMPLPGEPRCCPTGAQDWTVDTN